MKNIFEPTSQGDLSKITKYLLGVTLFFNQTVLLTLKETFFSENKNGGGFSFSREKLNKNKNKICFWSPQTFFTPK